VTRKANGVFVRFSCAVTNLYKQFKDLVGDIHTAEVHVRPRVVILVDDEGMKLF
jgi:hypothetical protein